MTNLPTTIKPEQNLALFREEIFSTTAKMFSIAESALHSHKELEKVIILKRPPRFDKVSADPLQLKPQLSSLGNAFLFDLWCNSSYKNKIILGDHSIPHTLDDAHHLVYGHPDDPHYDGYHLRGPHGRKILQESIKCILNKAGMMKTQQQNKLPRMKHSQAPAFLPPVGPSPRNLSTPLVPVHYDPIDILRKSIRRNSHRQSLPEKAPEKTKVIDFTVEKKTQKRVRPSVITYNTTQSQYSVPVSNSFEALGNL